MSVTLPRCLHGTALLELAGESEQQYSGCWEWLLHASLRFPGILNFVSQVMHRGCFEEH